jgi:hypothetical protein
MPEARFPRRTLLKSPVNKRGALPYTLLQEIANALGGQFINLCLRAKMPSLIFGTNYKAYP